MHPGEAQTDARKRRTEFSYSSQTLRQALSNRVDTPSRTPSVQVTLAAALDELKAQLAAAGERETRLAAQLAAAEARASEEAAKAGQAISAFAALAERLDALAEERRRPWWRRLVS